MFKVVNHLMWLGGSFGCSCGKRRGEKHRERVNSGGGGSIGRKEGRSPR